MPFHPRFPLFLIGRNGCPLVSCAGDVKTALGYSSRELAELAGERFLEQGFQNIGVLSVSTAERFRAVTSQLIRHQVTQLSWDYLGPPAVRTVVMLAELR